MTHKAAENSRIRKCREADRDFFINHPILKNHISLLERIKKMFSPDDNLLFIKAPGRVNLIGEHTDYNMGPVLPCAIDKEIVFCLKENATDEIHVSNVDEKFEDFHFSIDQPIEAYSNGYWGNYIKAGTKGILDYIASKNNYKTSSLKGYDAIVSGTLPLAAGMSSSSALVVASAFSFILMNQLDVEKLKLAEICAKAEHFVGTAGGGMDQTVSIMGKKNSFLKIDFNPLRINIIPAPKNIQIILFHSLIEAEKSGKVRLEYNRRVLECRMAVDLFNRFIKDQFDQKFQPVNFIGEVQSQQFNLSDTELDNLVSHFLDQLPETFFMDAISSALDLSEEDLEKRYQAILQNDRLVEPNGGFIIKGRFKHVYTECQRVSHMVECLSNNNMPEIGGLLNASHKSLADDYEVSTPEVDELVRLLLENGALGARLMGAGFGGMVLAITDNNNTTELIENVKKVYYQKEAEEDIENYIFPCVAADGVECL